MSLSKNKKIIIKLIKIFVLILAVFDFAVLFYLKKSSFSYQPYVAENISLVSSQQSKNQVFDDVDFLLTDLKAQKVNQQKIAIIGLDSVNQKKDIKSLTPLINNFYLDIFNNKNINQSHLGIFDNQFDFNLPFEVKTYLTEEDNLYLFYNYSSKKAEFVLPGQLIKINGETVKLNSVVILSVPAVEPDSILQIGKLMIALKNYQNDLSLPVSQLKKNQIKIYQLDQRNLLASWNPSFENGPWVEKVADCSAYLSGEPELTMKLNSDSTAGKKSLELSARNHFACTYQSFPVKFEKDKIYQVTLDYKNLEGQKIQYYYNLRNQGGQVQEKFSLIKTVDQKWHNLLTIIEPEISEAINFDFYLYAPADNNQRVVNLYDNLNLSSYQLKKEIKTDNLVFPVHYRLANWFILRTDKNIFEYPRKKDNLIFAFNPSFENGFWTTEAEDCSNYLEGSPKIGMKLIDQTQDGKKAIELSAQSHFACTYQSFPVRVDNGKLYKLSFNYRSLAGNKVQYYYHLKSEWGQDQEFYDVIEPNNTSWNLYQVIIDPKIIGVDSVDLYLYAPSDGSHDVINWFDNVRLEELTPKEIYTYYLYARQTITATSTFESLKFQPVNRWQNKISLKQVQGRVLLVYPTSYNTFLKLKLDSGTGISKVFLPHMVSEENHFQINDNQNGWLIDTAVLCQSDICQKNNDGTFNLDLLLENRWLNWLRISLVVSLGVFLFLALTGRFRS